MSPAGTHQPLLLPRAQTQAANSSSLCFCLFSVRLETNASSACTCTGRQIRSAAARAAHDMQIMAERSPSVSADGKAATSADGSFAGARNSLGFSGTGQVGGGEVAAASNEAVSRRYQGCCGLCCQYLPLIFVLALLVTAVVLLAVWNSAAPPPAAEAAAALLVVVAQSPGPEIFRSIKSAWPRPQVQSLSA